MQRKYTDSDVVGYAKEVRSLAQLLNKLGLKPAGGNYANMKRLLQKLKVDCEHWDGQGWSKDQQLKDWSKYTEATSVKKHLIILRGHQCEMCKNTIWLNEPIPLDIHHVSGDKTDNSLPNVQLLCGNCHGLTKNWRGRKNKIR